MSMHTHVSTHTLLKNGSWQRKSMIHMREDSFTNERWPYHNWNVHKHTHRLKLYRDSDNASNNADADADAPPPAHSRTHPPTTHPLDCSPDIAGMCFLSLFLSLSFFPSLSLTHRHIQPHAHTHVHMSTICIFASLEKKSKMCFMFQKKTDGVCFDFG